MPRRRLFAQNTLPSNSVACEDSPLQQSSAHIHSISCTYPADSPTTAYSVAWPRSPPFLHPPLVHARHARYQCAPRRIRPTLRPVSQTHTHRHAYTYSYTPSTSHTSPSQLGNTTRRDEAPRERTSSSFVVRRSSFVVSLSLCWQQPAATSPNHQQAADATVPLLPLRCSTRSTRSRGVQRLTFGRLPCIATTTLRRCLCFDLRAVETALLALRVTVCVCVLCVQCVCRRRCV